MDKYIATKWKQRMVPGRVLVTWRQRFFGGILTEDIILESRPKPQPVKI